MTRLIAICTLLLASQWAYSQSVLWADKVIEYSSEFGEKQYAHDQILGKPNVLPNLGLSPNAWTPERKNKKEYIKVGFARSIAIQQIAIAETHNPGSIASIFAYDADGNEYLVNQSTPKSIPIEGRLFRLFVEKTPYEVAALKIVFDGKVIDDYFSVDAVAISDSRDPITVEINITDDINNDYIPIALDSNVNTIYNELRPLISPDGNNLYFSRQNSPENVGGVNDDEDIWVAKRDTASGLWQKAENVGYPLNNKGPNFINSISADGSTMLLLLGNQYYSKNRMTQGVSMSSKADDGSWTKPVNLHIENDYNYSEKANYFMTNNGEALIMAVERDDTYGDRDFYISFKREDGTFSEPMNMGDVINSADEEGSPFLSSDGKTLFFSSKGFSGFGGFDIYMTRRLDDTWTNWSEPENLGATFNSREDDVFFNFTENDEYAYFTRGDLENTDIYRVKLPYYQRPQMLASLMDDEYMDANIIVVVKGTVYNAKTMETIEASIEYFQQPDSVQYKLAKSDSVDGRYQVEMQEGFLYDFKAKSQGFYPSTDSVDLRNITESTEIVKDIYLDPIEEDKPIVLNNVNFDFDSDKIRKESYPELNKLAELINDNPQYKLSIFGHTCWMGPEYYNQDLSERRAKSVVRYLSEQGNVERERMNFEGFGELKPMVSNETERGRELNRRVEFQLQDKSTTAEAKTKTADN